MSNGLSLRRDILVALLASFVLVAVSSTATSAGPISTLVDMRAAHYPGYDRIMFEFEGPMPDVSQARWLDELRMDPSHKFAHVQGDAFIRVRFRWAGAVEVSSTA